MEHRSDNEAGYEDEEVDPRIQVRGYHSGTAHNIHYRANGTSERVSVEAELTVVA